MNIHELEKDVTTEELYPYWNDMFKRADIKVLVAIPTYDFKIHLQVMMGLFMLWKPKEFAIRYSPGPTIDVNRNKLVDMALMDEKVTHVLFIDTDTMPPPNLLSRFLQYDELVMSGLYIQRMVPFRCTQFLKFSNNSFRRLRVADYPEGELVKVDSTGAGALLVKREVFERLEEPYFKFILTDGGKNYLGEDIYFCRKLAEEGIPIHVDTSIMCQHIEGGLAFPHLFEKGLLKIGEKMKDYGESEIT